MSTPARGSRRRKIPASVLLAALSTLARAQSSPESRYYTVDFLPTPPGSLEVGGMDFLPDGRLVVSTRHGQVWIVDEPCAEDPADAKLHLFAEGLYEGLGLAVVGGEIVVVQRTELSRLRDVDGDGTCDTIETLTNDWGVSGNYHEFAYGLPHDAAGNFYLSFNVSFFDPKWWHGKSPAKWRGWVVQVARDGGDDDRWTVHPFASGFRSPNGLGLNAAGDLFATDNQGDWMPSCPLFHVQKDRWYGHPASLEWSDDYVAHARKASDTEPPPRPRAPPALWIPYGLARSVGNPCLAATGGKFGPFDGQLFVAELTNGCVLRTDLEKVGGEYQGAVMQFRRDTGSANRLCFAPDGTLFVGLTNRGWGGAPPADGIARVRFTGRVPMELRTVRLLAPDAARAGDRGADLASGRGFDLGFTLPLATGEGAGGSAANGSPADASRADVSPANVSIVQYDYNSWWDYGCPEMHVTPVEVTAVELSADRTHLFVRAPSLQAGRVARIVLSDLFGRDADGPDGPGEIVPLLHPQADYTINRLHGMQESIPVAKTVAPPSTREDREEGWVTFFDRRSIEGFDAPGWRLAAVHMDPTDPTALAEHAMVDEWDGMLVNVAGGADAVSRFLHGDCDARIEFMVPRGSNSGVYFQGRYEVQILDSFGKRELDYGDCGGIYEGRIDVPNDPESEDHAGEQGGEHSNGFAGSAPRLNACNAPGEWQRLDVRFRAPRFDAAGRKVTNARFDWVRLNGELIQQDVEVQNATRGGFEGAEVAYGPLRLQGDHGPVAYKKVRLRRIAPEGADAVAANTGWTRLFDGRSLDGWTPSGTAKWSVEDGAIVGRGGAGLLVPRGDYVNLEQRAQVQVDEHALAGFLARAPGASSGPVPGSGYVAQANASNADPQRTGSIRDRVPVTLAPVRSDQWFELRVRCVDETGGTRVTVWVNDVQTADFLDAARTFARGHVALQLDDGGEARFKDVEVRELP